jgi:UrcA family protein
MSTVIKFNRGARQILISGLAVVTLGFAWTSTFAASPDETSSITVSYAELDLSQAAGAQILYNRIQQAAFEVCSGFTGPFSVIRTKASPCYKNAVSNAVAQINSPRLSALHRARTTRLASN